MVSHFDRHSHYTTDRGSVKLLSPGRRHHQNPLNTRPPQPREGWGGSFTGDILGLHGLQAWGTMHSMRSCSAGVLVQTEV